MNWAANKAIAFQKMYADYADSPPSPDLQRAIDEYAECQEKIDNLLDILPPCLGGYADMLVRCADVLYEKIEIIATDEFCAAGRERSQLN